MKKVFIIIFVFLLLYLFYTKEYNMSENTIRFRVIANSNSNRDILMKEKVVSELSDVLFIETDDEDEMRANIYSNLENIENKINILFKNNNYDKDFNVSYGLNEFPKKVFLGKEYDSGIYESLVIKIGDAKGNNYFCILYPSLCMLDYENKEEKNTEYSFKIVEIIKDLF